MTKPAIHAAIDLGSNSFRLLIAALQTNGTIQTLAKELITVRLGQDLHATGNLSPEAMDRGLAALTLFAEHLAVHQPCCLRICATHALRVAANRAEFLTAAARLLGQPVEVIDGHAEAALALAGVRQAVSRDTPLMVADVGGGSSEVIWENGVISLTIGAVNLTERFLAPEQPPSPAALAKVRAAIADTTSGINLPALPPSAILAGSGGTATALAALDLRLTAYDEAKVQGHCLSLARLRELIDQLAHLDATGRNQLPGLDQGRGEILLAGALIYEHLLTKLGAATLTVSDAGLLEGILLSTCS